MSEDPPMTERTGITLRLTAEDREALDAQKTCLGEPAASRALLHVARLYPRQHQALQDALNELAQARADRYDLLEAVSAAEQARQGLINTASRIGGKTTDAKARNRSLVLAVWLYDTGILSRGVAAAFAGIPDTVLRYRIESLGVDPAHGRPKDELTHYAANDVRRTINEISDTLINRDPEIMSGTPVFMGTQVPVRTLFEHLVEGHMLEYFLMHFPAVSRELAVRLLGLAAVKLTADTVLELHKPRQQKEHPASSTGSVINIDPDIVSGAPVFMGTRVPLSILIDHLMGGYTLNYFVDQYPTVSREQVVQFLELATEKLTADTGSEP